ncbi:MAG: hypothetical protein FWG84_02605 [Bacteroidales bacterium]|nr:hypothetical protein [Bacteroidales bacterium]
MKSQQIKQMTVFILFFISAMGMFAQTVAEQIAGKNIGDDIKINGYVWRVALKETKSDGHEYAMLYGMSSFHYARFGATNVYSTSDVRTAFNKRYATDKEYSELRQIAVIPILGTVDNFDSPGKTTLPAYPQLASATGVTDDIVFLPTVRDIMDWKFNVAGTFGHVGTHYRLIARNPYKKSPNTHLSGLLTPDNKKLQEDGGIQATSPNPNGYQQFRPSIWVRISPVSPTIGAITAPAPLCAGASLTLSAPSVESHGVTIASQGWQIETNSGTFTGITLPYPVFYGDNGKKLRYYITYNNEVMYSNEVSITIGAKPVLTQPNSATFCHGESVSSISFTGTDVSSATWQVTSGSGTSIGMNANSGTGAIPAFVAKNTGSGSVTVTITVTPTSAAGCAGDTKTFTLSVAPPSTASDIIARDTTICLESSVDLFDLVKAPGVIKPNFKWYQTANTTTPMTITTVVPPPGEHTYYVSVSGDNYCEGEASTIGRKKVTVKVNPTANANHIEVRDTTIYLGRSLNLNVLAKPKNISNHSFKWYAMIFDEHPIAPVVSPSTVGAHYYYVAVEGDEYCEGGPENRKVVTVNVVKLDEVIEIEVCEDESVTFTATPLHGGDTPAYQWFVNEKAINGATGQKYTYTPENGDVVRCEMTSSINCADPGTVSSLTITVIVHPRPDAPTILPNADFTFCAGDEITYSWVLSQLNYKPTETFVALFTDEACTVSFTDRIASQSFQVYALAQNLVTGCITDPEDALIIPITVYPRPNAPVMAAGANPNVCDGDYISDYFVRSLITPNGGDKVLLFTDSNAQTPFIEFFADYSQSPHIIYAFGLGEGGCMTLSKDALKITINVHERPDAPVIPPNTNIIVCAGDVITTAFLKTAINHQTPPEVLFFTDAACTNPFTDKAVYQSFQLYALAKNMTTGCITATENASIIPVTVYPRPEAPTLKAFADTTVCDGELVNFTFLESLISNPHGMTLEFFVNSACTIPFGDFYADYSTATLHTIYVVGVSAGNCTTLPADALEINIKVKPIAADPALITANDVSICGEMTATLSAIAPLVENPVFHWYANATTTDVLFTGSIYTTAVLTETTTFYVSVEGDNYCEGDANENGRKAVKVTVNPSLDTPALTANADTNVCDGQTIDNDYLTALITPITNLTVEFYTDAACTEPFTTIIADYDAKTSHTVYAIYVNTATGCATAADDALEMTITVNPRPETPAMVANADTSVCDGTIIDNDYLTDLITSVPGLTVKFYTDAACTNEVTTITANHNTAQSHTFYAIFVNNVTGCATAANDALEVTITVKPHSTADMITVYGDETCSGSSATLEASMDKATGTPIYRWYADATTDKVLHTGAIYVIDVITDTTTFYVSVEDDKYCEGEAGTNGRQAVTVTVTPLVTPSVTISVE